MTKIRRVELFCMDAADHEALHQIRLDLLGWPSNMHMPKADLHAYTDMQARLHYTSDGVYVPVLSSWVTVHFHCDRPFVVHGLLVIWNEPTSSHWPSGCPWPGPARRLESVGWKPRTAPPISTTYLGV